MQHDDHVRLLRGGVEGAGSTWADIGAGGGAFTLALADLLGAGATIYAVDRDAGALRTLERTLPARFPDVTLHCQRADFTAALRLPALDGIVMANALHFVQPGQQAAVLARLRGLLQAGGRDKPGGRFVIVEYNTDRGNLWVPHPLSWGRFETLARQAGFADIRLLATHPSSFLKEFYAAVAEVSVPT